MSDSSDQGSQPPYDPYGGQDSGEQPPGPPPSANPYGQQPNAGETPPSNPYGQQPGQSPYGQQPGQNPYGQQPGPNPYGPPPAQNPYGAAYGQPAGPLGDGLDMYGRPLGRRVSDERPGTVTAAGWITLVLAGLSFLLYGFLTLAMLVAKDDVLTEIDKAIQDSGQTGTDFSAEDAYGLVVAVLVVLCVWCLIACVLAVLTMRRGKVARILLIISSGVTALFSLLGITSIVSAVPLLGSIAVIVLLFAGGASDWFRNRY